MKIGITGTRSGMNIEQKMAVVDFLANHPTAELHHGDCVGVDVEVAEIAADLGLKTVCHPPVIASLRAFHESDEVREPFSYFERNRHIVHEADILLVIPWEDSPQPTGGTWYTHDFAKKVGKEFKVIYPNRH
jgi:hypothetical protein